MKAEHRHELQTNELAAWLEDTIEKLKPYTRLIIGLAVALLVILGVYTYLNALERRGQTEASDQYVAALNSLSMSGDQDLRAVVDRYRGTPPAVLAQLVLAEAQLSDGTNELYTNKSAAREKLSRSAGDFNTAEQTTHDPMLRAWALYGQGRAYESLGSLERARTAYQTLIKDYPESALLDAARNHLNQLDRGSVKDFYDWFAKQEPKPEALDKSTGVPGVKPPFDLSEPSGDIKFPGVGDSKDTNPEKPTGDTSTGGISLPSMKRGSSETKSTTDTNPPSEANSPAADPKQKK
ncbi:MAG TPA: tetratricopeptide repeat protein [Pirellulales bacterium]|jgi:tetratricopeptide (TPR) repeat protein